MSCTSSSPALLVARIDEKDDDDIQEIRRTAGVGASEIAAVFGLSKWTTELELYALKRGEIPRWKGNRSTDWGRRAETMIVGYRAEQAAPIGRTVVQPNRIYRSAAFPDATVSPDALEYPITARVDLDAPSPPVCLDDAKTADSFDERAWRTGLPPQYVLQLQQGAFILGADTVALDVLFGGNRPRRFEFAADPELGEMLATACKDFMDRVREGRPPAPQPGHSRTAELMAQLYAGRQGEKLHLDDEDVRLVRDLQALQEQQSWVKAEIETLRNRLRDRLRNGTEGYVIGPNGKPLTLVTWSATPEEKIEVDLPALRRDHPHLYRMVERRVGRPASRSTRMSVRKSALAKIPNPEAQEN